jgi:hypothetical protein
VLVPREFTKVDEIVDLVFSATEAREEEADEREELRTGTEPRFTPVQFNEACIKRIESHVGISLVKRSRSKYESNDGNVRVVCAVSRARSAFGGSLFWFAFHPHQKEFLDAAKSGYVAFGCGSEQTTVLLAVDKFYPWLPTFWQTNKGDRFYWHVQIVQAGDHWILRRGAVGDTVEIGEHMLPILKEGRPAPTP